MYPIPEIVQEAASLRNIISEPICDFQYKGLELNLQKKGGRSPMIFS